MTVGNLMALQQTDIKRLLAFSSIAQMGYILLAVSVGTVLGLTAGLLHVMNHAIMKGLLFLCAGAFVHAVGTRNLDELTGIGHKMNITGVIFTVGALAISGIPPLNGFVSEFMIVFSAFDAKLTIFAVIMLINILIGFGYYLRLLYILVWKAPGDNLAKVKEAPVAMLLPMGILMLLCVIIGIWPGPFIDFASRAAQAISDITTYITAT
jgi:formate hydrogenlyase subunit 3/multisubunit Na+/H+ antiporter MnhD subunit